MLVLMPLADEHPPSGILNDARNYVENWGLLMVHIIKTVPGKNLDTRNDD